MDWQDDFWRLVAERDQAKAHERDAWERQDRDAAGSAHDRQVQAEIALDKLLAKKRERHWAAPRNHRYRRAGQAKAVTDSDHGGQA
jgi:hypothetical protein